MNKLTISAALLICAVILPAAYAQQSVRERADDLLPASSGVPAPVNRAPWIVADPANSPIDPAARRTSVNAPQVDLKFADEVPLQPGMFDSATAWEDEP